MITPDPATPEGAAVIDLYEQMTALQERTGEWPGADTVGILDAWLAGFGFTCPPAPSRTVAGSARVLLREDRHGQEVTLWADENSALACLAQRVRSSWDNVAGDDGIPHCPPLDDREAVSLYYGPRAQRADERYSLYADDIELPLPAVSNPGGFRFPGEEMCAEANSAAVFHPMTDRDDEGLPRLEVAKVLAFVYLEPDRRAVRVSVHLYATDELIVQPGGTVALLVEVGDSTVFCGGAAPTHAARPRLRRWLRRLVRRGGPTRGD
ncbi:hypothetical protein ACFH04_06805 [Streptomyces noboritoensis]|uniref:PE-PGRS family protein n=1 Tax=Streptomyces noboritoensis TaxID=67337 RepID=A0ABV6TDF1_9ACTN